MLLLWPGKVRRKREDDLGRIGPALFAGTNISDLSIKKISSTSYRLEKISCVSLKICLSYIYQKICPS